MPSLSHRRFVCANGGDGPAVASTASRTAATKTPVDPIASIGREVSSPDVVIVMNPHYMGEIRGELEGMGLAPTLLGAS